MKNLLPVLAMAASLAPALAQAARGDLDPSFADHGRLGPMPEFAGVIWAVEVLEGGGALIGGGDLDIQSHRDFDNPRNSYFVVNVSNFVSLLAADGAADPGYHSTDIEGIDIGAVVRQADGKVISAGSRVTEGITRSIGRSQLAVFRLASDGSLDTGFGANGIFEWSGGENSYGHQARSLALEPDGRIIVAGKRGITVADVSTSNLVVLRLLANGSLDGSFGAGGVSIGPPVDSSGEIRVVRNIVGGGYRVSIHGAEGCVIVGLSMSGAPEAAFGSAGIATVESPGEYPVACNSLESLADGNLLVAGSAGENGFVARLLANGAPDPTFAADAAIASLMTQATSIAAAAEGQVLVAGSGLVGASIVRLRASGQLDSTFGDGGRTWIDLDSELGSTPVVLDMAVREDGGVIAGGGDIWTDQSFVVRLLGDNGGASPGVVSFLQSGAKPLESDGQAVVRVRRTGGSDGDVSVMYRTLADEEATADQDFTATSGSLQWADGDSSDKEIVVGIAQDGGAPEAFESFHVALDNAQGGAGVGTHTATVTIQPDGAPAGQIEIDDTDYGLAGENGIGQIWLFRNYYFDGTVCVTVTPRSGTAIAGEDFNAVPSTVCWGDQDFDSKLAEIPFIDDNTQEGDESFYVELSNPTGGAVIGPHASATITIAANDEPVSPLPPPPPAGGGGAAGVPELLLGLVWLFAQRRRLHYR